MLRGQPILVVQDTGLCYLTHPSLDGRGSACGLDMDSDADGVGAWAGGEAGVAADGSTAGDGSL